MNLIVRTSDYLDVLFWAASYAPEELPKTLATESEISESYLKTYFYTSVAKLDNSEEQALASLPTGVGRSAFVECAKEIRLFLKENDIEFDRDQINFERWSSFFELIIANNSIDYETLVKKEIRVDVILSDYCPEPPVGQMVRVDDLGEAVELTIVIGSVPFAERSNRKYQLNEVWFQRGIQIGLMKHLVPYRIVEAIRNEMRFEDITDELLSKFYKNILWYLQIRHFSPEEQRDNLIDIAVQNGLTDIRRIAAIDLELSEPFQVHFVKPRLVRYLEGLRNDF